MKITWGYAWQKQEAKRTSRLEYQRRAWQRWQDTLKEQQ